MMPTTFEIVSSDVIGSTADHEHGQNQRSNPENRSGSVHKPVVVGLYGVPGVGKTFLLKQLKQQLGQTQFAFYEGSNMLAFVVPGGLDAFQKMEEQEKRHWRQRAIDTIGKQCADSGQVAVVTGHFMFWSQKQEVGLPVYTQNDLDVFTHILYLDTPAELVERRCLDDTEKSRTPTSASHLRRWQQEEKTQLRHLCRHHGILFLLITPSATILKEISILLHDFRHHDEQYNLCRAQNRLDDAVVACQGQLETVLVMDADRTLAADDTGALYWGKVSNSQPLAYKSSTLKVLFQGPLGHSYTAFRQAMLLYEETSNDHDFDVLCQEVASTVTMHPEIVSLLQLVADQQHVGAVVITCGLRSVWEKVLEREGLSGKVKVVGGGRIADGFVVTAAVKTALVARLREVHKLFVWAFGDSPQDLDMFRTADRGVVVVGEEQTRSKTMDEALLQAINNDSLRVQQTLLPS